MLIDHCTWDDDYKAITQDIRQRLLAIGNFDSEEYTSVLMQGSGTFGVESMLTSLTSKEDTILVLSNGKYGERLIEILDYAHRNYVVKEYSYEDIPKAEDVDQILSKQKEISHIVMVHSETTSGILNDIESIGKIAKEHGKYFFVDAMSSYGGVDVDYSSADALVSSSNKCIEGVPGFSYVICKKNLIEGAKGNASTLSLDLYDQYQEMADGKWRYTSPTHAVVAFQQALDEFEQEGGIKSRSSRYHNNQETLSAGMEELGFKSYIEKDRQGPIITTFTFPENMTIEFQDMYDYIKDRGYAIYPGKLTDIETFRIGSIGQVFESDMKNVIAIIKDYLREKNYI